ncbi:ABC transporter permease [uncultured Eubacterium sp.]|uniref:ABC transporter permease n=1 Tax=uncultured Eubacterium sp. TaxID=165185 RepID=UPI0025CF280E|nr:ABC transporter permease [uncultured Eubacterium sp.]
MSNIYVRLAKTNIQNNRQLYLPYIISGIVTVMMFYLMVFINNNPGLDGIPGSTNLKTIMALGVGVVAIFAYIFIFYTNSFIIKRRKKEIGVYNILGMEKRHIAKVLGLETVFVAVIAIVCGILSGIVFSKLILMLLYRMLGFQESVSFFIAKAGIRKAILIFGVLYLLTLLYNLLQIRLANPIELLRGGNVGEKEPKTKGVMAVAGAACLAVAYYIAITTQNPIEVLFKFFLAVVLVIAGTYFLFTAGSIAILKMLRKNKKFYYNKKHFTAVSGMLYRMKQNAAGLASICVLSTMVLVMISMTVSMFAGVDDELKARYPYELSYTINANSMEENVNGQELYQTIADTIEKQGRKITDSSMCSYFQIFMKRSGSEFEMINQDMNYSDMAVLNFLTRENMLANDSSLKAEDVPEPEVGKVDIYSKTKYEDSEFHFLGQDFAVDHSFSYGSEADSYLTVKDILYVVADEATLNQMFELQKEAGSDPDTSSMYSQYETQIEFEYDGTKEEKLACADAVKNVVASQRKEVSGYLESRTDNEKEFYALYGGLFFLGLFLGIMFLMVTVMIIFYKQISEGYDDRERYVIMEKVGMSNAEVKSSIQSQIRIVFFLPLVMAAVHVAAAFPMIRRLLALLNLTNVPLFVTCLIVTILVFTAIYYLVFRITSRAYYKIVSR